MSATDVDSRTVATDSKNPESVARRELGRRIGSFARAWSFVVPFVALVVVFVAINELRTLADLKADNVSFCAVTNLATDCKGSVVQLLQPGATLAIASKDMNGRLHIVAALALLAAAAITLLWFCIVRTIYHAWPKVLDRRAIGLLVTSATIVLFVAVWLLTATPRQVSVLLGSFDALLTTLADTTVARFASLDEVAGGLAVACAAVMALTSAFVIHSVSSVENELESLRERCTGFRASLAAGAALLASTVIVARSLQYWTLGFLSDGDANALREVADSWSVTLGTYWTIVLIAIYMPAATALHRAALNLAKKNAPAEQKTRDEWLEEHGLNVSVRGQTTRVLLLLAPWLSGGSLAEIFESFLK